jgi:hypothetical protein
MFPDALQSRLTVLFFLCTLAAIRPVSLLPRSGGKRLKRCGMPAQRSCLPRSADIHLRQLPQAAPARWLLL